MMVTVPVWALAIAVALVLFTAYRALRRIGMADREIARLRGLLYLSARLDIAEQAAALGVGSGLEHPGFSVRPAGTMAVDRLPTE